MFGPQIREKLAPSRPGGFGKWVDHLNNVNSLSFHANGGYEIKTTERLVVFEDRDRIARDLHPYAVHSAG